MSPRALFLLIGAALTVSPFPAGAETRTLRFDDVFADWEDRWWPHPMDRSMRAPLSGLQSAAMAAE